ncbi:lactonase family protein [Pseudoalteromonas xiamenensis]|uniref:lactonase family protein n=1 Tax=Pseudoalteromonas xiamenensis TaxID=882626 RepID=UPI0027E429F5|nr:beta-propeller fold lactonase family protein [Pseudoalteromonas xiamenensis]WMN59680.1 lactonase family protein [Pseudoalteromonas xiamenensis]
MRKRSVILALCAGLTWLCNANEATNPLALKQYLLDDVMGVDGLGNPRNIAVSGDGLRVFVASGDDNALATFAIDASGTLSFQGIAKNSQPDTFGLEGATGVVALGNSSAVVSGFYDGAISVFTAKSDGLHSLQTLSDKLGYEQVFHGNESVGALDKLGLLGAWDVVKTKDSTQLFVASYMSNAVAVFNITATNTLTLSHIIKATEDDAQSLGNPIGLALADNDHELYVSGFEGNQVTVFHRNDQGALTLMQVIKNGENGVKDLLQPQKIVASKNGRFLYVASAKSGAINVFKRSADDLFVPFDIIDSRDIGGSGLEGASSLALSSNGKRLFAAGEGEKGC